MEQAGRRQSENDELKEREREATSKETLKEVREQSKNAGGVPSKQDNRPPSPDGALDEERELKDSDPI
ncbi:MAG TPA: hypothetical protein VIG25_13070 [Pyrinomonadaceae bacterium]|jgi:hypothetical protein